MDYTRNKAPNENVFEVFSGIIVIRFGSLDFYAYICKIDNMFRSNYFYKPTNPRNK